MSTLSVGTIVGGLSPPPGVTPNFEDPYSIGPLLHGLYIMFVTWLGFLAYCAVGYPALKYGAGVHQWNVPAINVISWAKWGAISEVMYPPLIALTKLSICIQFLHIFVPGRTTKYWCVQQFSWLGPCTLALFPIPQKGSRSVEKADCDPRAVVASILRIVYSSINNESHDSTYHLSQVGMCTVGEISAGIMIGNLILFPRFFKAYTPKLLQLFSSYRGSTISGSHKPSDPASSTSWQKIPGKANPDERSGRELAAESIELGHSIGGMSQSSREQ
ncbi:hypothetical protein NHQ30_006297 [Ciborinia camelliae]|nr:hypothetical protein NHQ30_006297 [Ciborinia camelliae]